MASASPPAPAQWSANAASGWSPNVFFQVGAAFSSSNPHRFARTCAWWHRRCPGWSAGDGPLEPVVVDVVGEVADQPCVLHAEGGGGELGVEVVDELGDPGLPAGRRCGARGREPARGRPAARA